MSLVLKTSQREGFFMFGCCSLVFDVLPDLTSASLQQWRSAWNHQTQRPVPNLAGHLAKWSLRNDAEVKCQGHLISERHTHTAVGS